MDELGFRRKIQSDAARYGIIQWIVLLLTITLGMYVIHYPLPFIKTLHAEMSPWLLFNTSDSGTGEAIEQQRMEPQQRMWWIRFDHPEPNFQILSSCAEYWTTLTTIPIAGIQLLLLGLYYDFPLPVIYMYLHTTVMYCGAFISHMTLYPTCFTMTVSAVIGNSLIAFWLWGSEILPILNRWSSGHFFIFICGLGVDLFLVLYLPHILGEFGGFKMLAVAQPPFVLLGWLSAEWIYRFKYPSSPGVHSLCIGGKLLISAMALSSIETFIEPWILSKEWMFFPVIHVVIHIVEQIGIYYYGIGVAWLHMNHSLGQPDVYWISHSALLGLPIVIVSTLSDKEKGRGIESKPVFNDHVMPSQNTPDETISSQQSTIPTTPIIDLLDESIRRNPFPFYETLFQTTKSHLNTNNNKSLRCKGPIPVVGEQHMFAVYDIETITTILKDDVHFSSNPYQNGRFLGLSTSSHHFHRRLLKLIGPYYTSEHLKMKRAHILNTMISRLTTLMIEESQNDNNPPEQRRYDIYKWANRIATVSGLAALGFSEETCYNVACIDQLRVGSLNMVKAVAPVGGSGCRHNVSLKLLLTIIYELWKAIPSTLHCIWEIGVIQAWKLFRPIDTVIFDLFTSRYQRHGEPRSGILQFPGSVGFAAIYFQDLNRIWLKESKLVVPSSLPGGGTAASSSPSLSVIDVLRLEEYQGRLERHEVLGLLAQLTVGMTIANGIMSAVYRLMTEMNEIERMKVIQTPDLLSSFIYEVLRYDAPLQRLPRRVIAPIEIAGISLQPGDTIFLFLGMANVQQGNGLIFDYQQKSSILTPTEMFTFGKGTHRCLGQALSIMEMEISLKYLAESSLLEKKEIRSVEFERPSNIDVGNYGFTHLVFSTATATEDEDKDEKKNSFSNSAKCKSE